MTLADISSSYIGAFVDNWNDHPRPFADGKEADDSLVSTKREKDLNQSLQATRATSRI